MKTHVLKLGLPVLAMAFGVLSAFATIPEAETSLAPERGYLNTTTPCTQSIMCSTVVGPICEDANDNQLHGKRFENDPACPVVLYQPVQ
ncbi:DUF6520 family protein [Leeuwenhoekiella aestuarii]|uniref:Uncharacterized protein n=1 Tax=Leeuwenhoekiella aestuarii TaxID=2249426 RepID=A0A4Q0NRT4_9FLAO|nr:DUF6520 family protein [Leeuwenhoekiella aestuarii]RXG13124.1 hypothetical protein DSM04_105102 [Leeuwenhoekiella aestuarii]